MDSVIDVDGIKVGGKEKIVVIGGPCSVEGEKSIMRIAKEDKKRHERLRAPRWRCAATPRTSPYSFQGMGLEGLKCMCKAKQAYTTCQLSVN